MSTTVSFTSRAVRHHVHSVESPNVISGGSITLGTEKVAMTSENFLTKALPWGTGKPANADIKYKVIWK